MAFGAWGGQGEGGNLQPDDPLRGSADEVSLYTKVFNQRRQSFLYACICISLYIYPYTYTRVVSFSVQMANVHRQITQDWGGI